MLFFVLIDENFLEVWSIIKILHGCGITEWSNRFLAYSHGVNDVVRKDLNLVVK